MRTSFGAVILAQKITNHYQPVFAFAQLKVANRITTQFSMVVSTNSSLSFSFYHSSTQNRKPFKACGFAFSMMKNEGQRFPFHHPHCPEFFYNQFSCSHLIESRMAAL